MQLAAAGDPASLYQLQQQQHPQNHHQPPRQSLGQQSLLAQGGRAQLAYQAPPGLGALGGEPGQDAAHRAGANNSGPLPVDHGFQNAADRDEAMKIYDQNL